jgi:hypothetical protein
VARDLLSDRAARVTENLRDTLGGTRADNMTEAAECRSVCSPMVEGSLAASPRSLAVLRPEYSARQTPAGCGLA